jgi:hypothetical protein
MKAIHGGKAKNHKVDSHKIALRRHCRSPWLSIVTAVLPGRAGR